MSRDFGTLFAAREHTISTRFLRIAGDEVRTETSVFCDGTGHLARQGTVHDGVWLSTAAIQVLPILGRLCHNPDDEVVTLAVATVWQLVRQVCAPPLLLHCDLVYKLLN